jgi:hypothetical protein
MEDLIGFLIFIAIAAFSIISKMKSDRKAGTEQGVPPPDALPPVNLPDITKRMLFGEGEVIVAKPRRAKPETEQEESWPKPIWAAPTTAESPQPVAGRRIPYEMPRSAQPEPRRTPLEAMPTAMPSQRPYRPPQTPPRPSRSQPPPRQAFQQPPTKPVARKQSARTSPGPASAPRPQVSPRLATSTGKRPRGLVGMLHSKNDLARAIVLREVLGPPKAFE